MGLCIPQSTEGGKLKGRSALGKRRVVIYIDLDNASEAQLFQAAERIVDKLDTVVGDNAGEDDGHGGLPAPVVHTGMALDAINRARILRGTHARLT